MSVQEITYVCASLPFPNISPVHHRLQNIPCDGRLSSPPCLLSPRQHRPRNNARLSTSSVFPLPFNLDFSILSPRCQSKSLWSRQTPSGTPRTGTVCRTRASLQNTVPIRRVIRQLLIHNLAATFIYIFNFNVTYIRVLLIYMYV